MNVSKEQLCEQIAELETQRDKYKAAFEVLSAWLSPEQRAAFLEDHGQWEMGG